MSSFKSALQEEILQSLQNDYGVENYDEYRFGNWTPRAPDTPLNTLKRIVKKITGYKGNRKYLGEFLERSFSQIREYDEGLEFLYGYLDQDGKKLIVKLIAYRILGYRKVKLPFNNESYWEAIKIARELKIPNEVYDPHFMHFILEKFDLNPIGYDIKLYFGDAGIATDFIIQQYRYKSGENELVNAENGDTVLDVGGCWGDTALYFGSKVGENGRVYSFEFIPGNIKLLNLNTSLNPLLEKQIELVPNPVSDISGQKIYYKDNGPGSKIELEPFEGQTGSTTTISIDDFVARNNISKVDFIKMDIEGAELPALRGAIETIRKYRPKLAISIYHSMDDFVNIPRWILDLDLRYELFIGHYTINAEETVCFAKART